MSFRIHFHDVPHSQSLRNECESFAEELRAEFPEAQNCEVHLTHEGAEQELHLHVTGKDVDVAARSHARELRETLASAFERVRRQLRRKHDKQIYGRRHTSRANR